ncbi:MAG: molybdopterin-synthase adenylyltransferase MoeB [Campylobacteraceae bacterium]|jgi:adenylyltransferase/sulfurtransferase|nr:molybdopterin-synthase adenylyltransferase MoeB [Campylobacteraceae bacterium]
MEELTQDEITRYSRHIILPNVGLDGQKRLKNARVLIIGGGALGSPVALYLAAAGIGNIGIVDFDRVDVTNLQRQIIHTNDNIGKLKTESAKEGIARLNPLIKTTIFNTKLTSDNALDIIRDFDIVVDCTDNFPARYLVNDACVLLDKPLVYGSIFRFDAQASVFWAKKGACYRCLFASPPPPELAPSCGEGGVFGVLPGIIGSIQANEVIKLILDAPDTLVGRLIILDAWKMRFTQIKVQKDENCPICGKRPTIKKLIDYEDFCAVKMPKTDRVKNINAFDLKQKIDKGEKINIIDVREPFEFEMGNIKGSVNIPLNSVVSRMSEIDESVESIILCKSGVRSVYAIKALAKEGFKGKTLNLKGGIMEWAVKIDNAIAEY